MGVNVVDGRGVVVGVVCRDLLDTRWDSSYRLDFRPGRCPAPLALSSALPFPPRPRAPSCLPSVAHVTLPLLAPGPPPCAVPLALVRSLPPAPLPVSPVPPSVTPSLAFSAGARILAVPLHVPLAVPCVPLSAARALACRVCVPFPAAACTGALPVPLPSLAAASALALPLCVSPGAAASAFALPWRFSPSSAYLPPSVALRPSPRAPVAGIAPRPIAASALLDHVPLQVRQRDAWRRALGRRGADGLRPWAGTAWGGWCGLARLGVGAVLAALPAFRCGRGGPRRGPGARAGPVPRAGGEPGAVACCAGAAAAAPCEFRGPSRAMQQEQWPGQWGQPPRPASFQGRWFWFFGGRLGLLGWRPDQYCGLRQLLLLALRGGFPRPPRADGWAGEGLAVVAVVPLWGAV